MNHRLQNLIFLQLQRNTWAFILQWLPAVFAFALGSQTQIFLHALPIVYADYAISKPVILTQIERGEEPCPAGPWGQEKGGEEKTICQRKPNTSISLSPEQAPSPASPAQEELNQRQTPEQQQEEATMIPPEPGTGIPASTSPLSLKQEEESAEGGELPPSPSTDSLLSVEPGEAMRSPWNQQ